MTAPPRRDRPEMPDGYGVPADDSGLLDWADVERRLVEATVFWLATARPDGRPHVVPRWGVWLDGAFWYDGSPATRHARNLGAGAACTLHLEDGTRAVIVDGRSGPASPPGPELGSRLAAAFTTKYADSGYSPAPGAWEGERAGGLCRFIPITAHAWSSFPADVTRFRFG